MRREQDRNMSEKRKKEETLEQTEHTTFRSVSTNEELTDYGLQYSNGDQPQKRDSTRIQHQTMATSDKKKQKQSSNPVSRSPRAMKNTSRGSRRRFDSESDSTLSEPASAPSQLRAPLHTKNSQGFPRSGQSLTLQEPGPSGSARNKQNLPGLSGASKRKNRAPLKKLPIRSGFRAMDEIKKLQSTTHLLIPKAPFTRVVREILIDLGATDLRVTPKSLEALREASETYLIFFLEDAYLVCLHRGRVTLSVKDMKLVRFLRGEQDIINR